MASKKQLKGTTGKVEKQNKDPLMNEFVWIKTEVDDDEMFEVEENNYDHLDYKPQEVMDGLRPRKPGTAKRKGYKPKKTMKCDKCEYTTTYRNCLELHVLSHTSQKPLACELCSYTTKYPTCLNRHVLVHHQCKDDMKEGDFKCPVCDYTSYFKWNLYAHMRKHKYEKQFRCEHCPYATSYKHNFLKHNKVHKKQDMKFKCDKCTFVTKYEGHIMRHLAKIHNEVIEKAKKCDFCDFSTLTGWRLNVHKQRSKQDAALKCTYCAFETFYRCESKKHRVVHYNELYSKKVVNSYGLVNGEVKSTEVMEPVHADADKDPQKYEKAIMNRSLNVPSLAEPNANVEQKYECSNTKNVSDLTSNVYTNQCQDGIISLTDLNFTEPNYTVTMYTDSAYSVNFVKASEPQTSNGNKTYLLDKSCETDWKSIPVLHSENKELPFQCTQCKYTSKFKASVQRHFQRHHTGNEYRPYKCVNCDFSTKTKDQIALHNKRSQSEEKMQCKTCNYTTTFKCQFVIHQRSHYTHKCNICDYSCKHKFEIQRHFDTMHLDGGIKCRFCDFKATRKQSILCHETIHTGDKPFKCDLCSYSSVRKCLLDLHIKRYHSDFNKEVVIVSESKLDSLKVPITYGTNYDNSVHSVINHGNDLEMHKQGV